MQAGGDKNAPEMFASASGEPMGHSPNRETNRFSGSAGLSIVFWLVPFGLELLSVFTLFRVEIGLSCTMPSEGRTAELGGESTDFSQSLPSGLIQVRQPGLGSSGQTSIPGSPVLWFPWQELSPRKLDGTGVGSCPQNREVG